MGVTKGRVSQIEQGKISGQDVLARYATALGGQLHQWAGEVLLTADRVSSTSAAMLR